MATMEGLRSGSVAGLRLRPYAGEADLPHLVRIFNAEAEADGLHHRTNLGELTAELGHPSAAFDPARDVTIAELDGKIVGSSHREAIDTTDGFREYRLNGEVDPAFRRRGIGRALLEEGKRRHRELAATDGSTLPRIFGSWSSEPQAGARALLESDGFETARWFFEMVRPNLADVPEQALPDGLELRPIDRSLAKPVWDAVVEAFADHWGGFDGSDENLQRWLANPNTDLSLWVIAFDRDEVAGGIINGIDREQNAALGIQRGWLNSVFTRRAWRRRGLATALISRSLLLLRERGMTSAALGVDADNPTGALGLYEGIGFAVDIRSMAWRKAFS
jgi:ribosomal protein S18 acetylase RimI-like enzyme